MHVLAGESAGSDRFCEANLLVQTGFGKRACKKKTPPEWIRQGLTEQFFQEREAFLFVGAMRRCPMLRHCLF